MSSTSSTGSRGVEATSDSRQQLLVYLGWVSLALAVLGAVARIAPLFNHNGRLLAQFPTEDGYLMLTISRNLAIGNGMSVSDGTIPTNGTQPLAMLVWSAMFALSGGNRLLGVAGVQVCEIGFAVLAAFLLLRLGQALFGGSPLGRALSRLGAALWFASPALVPHTMNCLETGVYGVTVIGVALAFYRFHSSPAPWGARRIASMGGLLGLAFLARNDAVFLGVGFAAAHVLLPGAVARSRRLVEVVGVAAVAVVIGSPWIAFNVLRFGHPMPISGQSESLAVPFGQNLAFLPVSLAEYVGMVVAIPNSLEESLPARVVAGLFVVLVGGTLLVKSYRAADEGERRLFVLGAVNGTLLTLYYGFYFGAAHFLSRYLFPLAPFFVLLWMGALRSLLERAPGVLQRSVVLAAGAAAVLFSAGLGLRTYAVGARHQHFQVVRWVLSHVPPETWAGASQSGTLGFFHDRTINLDGKVNPESLKARREHRLEEYVLEKRIQFIADWADFAWWVKKPQFAPYFELLVEDREQNLAVLRRRGARLLGDVAPAKPTDESAR